MKCMKCGHEDFENITMFMGHPIDYWIDLQTRVDKIDATKLIEEIVHLKAKLYSYENHIQEMNEIRKGK